MRCSLTSVWYTHNKIIQYKQVLTVEVSAQYPPKNVHLQKEEKEACQKYTSSIWTQDNAAIAQSSYRMLVRAAPTYTASNWTKRFVRALYRMREPHALQMIGWRISNWFLCPQAPQIYLLAWIFTGGAPPYEDCSVELILSWKYHTRTKTGRQTDQSPFRKRGTGRGYCGRGGPA